jgi:hypothetical protein
MSEETNGKASKRLLKVYRGHFCVGLRHIYKAHPVIRLGGIYLSALDFQIGDEIEVTTERGRILITKVVT